MHTHDGSDNGRATRRPTGFVARVVRVVLTLALAACGSGEPTPSAAPEPVRSARPTTTSAPDGVRFHAGRLSVKVQDEPLHRLLAAIAAATGMRIDVSPSLRDRTVSGDVLDVPLVAGLMVLLRDFDVVLAWRAGAPATPAPSVTAAWVHPRGEGPGLAPLDAVVSTTSVARCTTTPDEPGTADPRQIAQDLLSGDPAVREAALGRSLAQPAPMDTTALRRLAVADPDPRVRALALTAWSHQGETDPAGLRVTLQQALQDRDEGLRVHAAQLLEQLDTAALPNDMAWWPPPAAPDPPPP